MMAWSLTDCPACGGKLARVKRRLGERLRYSALYQCRGCGHRLASPSRLSILCSLTCCCPRCGREELDRPARRDPIDALYHNPLSLAQGLLGAPLYWCRPCRLQFHDFRRPAARSTKVD